MNRWSTAAEIAAAVATGHVTARESVDSALEVVMGLNGTLNAFTTATVSRARACADRVDATPIKGPLAGVPFAVKNLIDVADLPTRAGSRINRTRAKATQDATLVRRLEAAGAICIGTLNMGEYAYDFTGENKHDGPSRNPHDRTRMTGGSSGGSGGAVASGMVPVALGSDTNGSIRVPASFCGIFGLKPTYGRLSRAGSFPFVASLDHLGPLARTTLDLALSYDAMQGHDPADACCADRAIEPTVGLLDEGASGLRVAIASGYFREGASPEAVEAVATVARALATDREIELPEAGRARSAAYVITTTEGAALHLDRLRTRAAEFDPDTRDRLIAGALVPASLALKAQVFRRWYREQILALFADVDAIIAPATPTTAPLIGQKRFLLDGVETPLRPNIGIYTQPISFIGLPVVAVPVLVPGATLPIGVQIIAAPWREDVALRIAHDLERLGAVAAPRPPEP